MARVSKKSILAGLQGSIGKELVFKQYRKQTVVSKYPDMSKVKATESQKRQRDLMKKANAYASMVKHNPKLSAKYRKKLQPGESVFHKAKKEFFKRNKK